MIITYYAHYKRTHNLKVLKLKIEYFYNYVLKFSKVIYPYKWGIMYMAYF